MLGVVNGVKQGGLPGGLIEQPAQQHPRPFVPETFPKDFFQHEFSRPYQKQSAVCWRGECDGKRA